MKRLVVLFLLTSLPGCIGFEEYYHEEEGWIVPVSAGCQTPTVGGIPAASSGIVPAVSQTPAIQTREPDLVQPAR